MQEICGMGDNGNVGVMWKTVSEACNLACDYCYYSTCAGKPGQNINRIDSFILEKFIQEYIHRNGGIASFAWQGGEPLLAGLDFFEEVVALQHKYTPLHGRADNAIQTNGTLITGRWAHFLKKHHFLVGVSLDGPKEIHDARRVDSLGQGSYDRVMRGIFYLKQHQVDFNILTVVHQGNVGRAVELMEFYKNEGFKFIQFIPCMEFRAQQGDTMASYDITPEQYGEFLCEIFDIWYNNGDPDMYVRFFDNLLNVYVNREAELCVHCAKCPDMIILEQNGDAYPCDFYMSPEWKTGNVATHSINELMEHPAQKKFAAIKGALPQICKLCKWKSLCHGGCPRNRQWLPDGVSTSADYFCAAYRKIYEYADERMKALGTVVRKRMFDHNVMRHLNGRPPRRNEPCACGSGKKYKHCCIN